MASSTTIEARLLKNANAFLNPIHRCDDKVEFRWQVLEHAAAKIGGYDIDDYYNLTGFRGVELLRTSRAATLLVDEIERTGIHPTLALASLAQPNLDASERRQTGSYFTDFRLARFAADAALKLATKKVILDPACGSGILLAATCMQLAGGNRRRLNNLLANKILGMDLSSHALRASKLVLSSLTADLDVIKAMHAQLLQRDSLMIGASELKRVAPHGVGGVVMNPPWERLRTTRHEFLSALGVDRHYGHTYDKHPRAEGLQRHKEDVLNYAQRLSDSFPVLNGREIDLYGAFLGLAIKLLEGGGFLSAIVPAGLIRSEGTAALRNALFERSENCSISLFDNRPGFFSIDSRFKFLVIKSLISAKKCSRGIQLSFPMASASEVTQGRSVSFSREQLRRTRRDFSIPEVRSESEWRLFRKLHRGNERFGISRLWRHVFCREVDMTRDRNKFLKRPSSSSIPVIEGRMVHQFTCAAKAYVSGTGRKAVWLPPNNIGLPKPQFWIASSKLNAVASNRIGVRRVGFCDITGQTNERAMLAAIVPPNVVCGNKVPTISFVDEMEDFRFAHCFVAIANSFVFDWILRRIFTTTVNYFILDSVPVPKIGPRSPLGERISQISNRILNSSGDLYSWENAELRAELDWRILRAYGANVADLKLILNDFPLLDRSEPVLDGEGRSTITRDFLLLRSLEALGPMGEEIEELKYRVQRARALGAVPYRPSHLAVADDADADPVFAA